MLFTTRSPFFIVGKMIDVVSSHSTLKAKLSGRTGHVTKVKSIAKKVRIFPDLVSTFCAIFVSPVRLLLGKLLKFLKSLVLFFLQLLIF